MTKTVVSGFAAAKAALRTPELAQALYDEGAQVMADALITLQGDAHRKRRITEFGVFKRGFFREYEQTTFPQTLQPILAPLLPTGEADLVDFGYRVTMNLTADFAGIDRHDDPEETAELLALVRKFSEGATLVHSTRDRATVRAEVNTAMQQFAERFLEPSKQRRLQLLAAEAAEPAKSVDLPNDVMTTLFRARDRLPLSDDVLRREIAFYLQAGAHSTANSMIRAMHEIFTWRAANPTKWLARAEDPVFIQRCVHESLRLNPASPVAWRRATCPVHTGADSIDSNALVEVDIRAANRDVSVFGADADRFNPERVVSPEVWPWGLTFGYGVHACMGRDLDGGVQFKEGDDPETHQYGIVTLLVRTLLAHGARPHSLQAPVADAGTTRHTWSSYPIQFAEVS